MTLLKLTRDQVTPEVTRPDPAKVVAGDPVHTTWNMEVRGNLFAGMWHATVGEWRISYTEWEYVHILEGYSVLTDEADGLLGGLGADVIECCGDHWWFSWR